MKKGIHPKYNSNLVAKCSCGGEFLVGSTRDELKTEVCSQCHPYYTGKQKLVDSEGRVEKFRAAQEKAKVAREKKASSKKK